MNTIKPIIQNRFQLISTLCLAMLFSIFLLAIRIKLNGSYKFLFLVWNLFLAIIPFVISTFLKNISNLNRINFSIWFLAWLLFLPNAPYIVTDLIHLKWSKSAFMWLDIVLVTSFALNGLVLFYLSIIDIKHLLLKFLSRNATATVLIFVFGLTGFGVYLGRFLRFNSWDILQDPSDLILDIITIIIYPTLNYEAWLFTFIFSLFLYITYQFFKMKI